MSNTIKVSDFQVTWADGTTYKATFTGKPNDKQAIRLLKVGSIRKETDIPTVKYIGTYLKTLHKEPLPENA
jgi:hypothetical protein